MSMKELCLGILRVVAGHEVTVTTRQGDGTIERRRIERHAITEPKIHEEFIIKYPIQEIDTAIRLLNMKGHLAKDGIGLLGPFYYALTESGQRIVTAGKFEAAEEKMLSMIPTANYPTALTELSDIRTAINKGFTDTTRGLTIIQAQLSQIENETIKRILSAIQQGRIEQGELSRTLDAIRRVLRFFQHNDVKLDEEIRSLTTKAKDAVESDLSLHQKLELTLPIVPFFLSFKIELDADSHLDLNLLLDEINQRWVTLNQSTW